MKKKFFIALISVLYSFISYAQQYCNSTNRISFQASISMNDTSEYSFGYHYLFCKYVGIGTDIGSWSENPDEGIIGENDASFYERQNLFIKPSLLVISPTLLKIKQCGFHIECQSGLMFSTRRKIRNYQNEIETYREYKTDCLSCSCDLGLIAEYDDVNFSIFYSLSNLDVNREYKNSTSNNFKKKLVESVGLKIGILL